jgi:triacylglycerol esterase/lipase EstA (alpha/beta hydrolase family)
MLKTVPRCLSWLLVALLAAPATALSADCVVLLHGLARTNSSMKPLVKPLEANGYQVVNVDYPSRKYQVEKLAPMAVEQLGVSQCSNANTIHFVTHSLGGILVRYQAEKVGIEKIGRVVMIAPPNQGSEVVDHLRDVPGFSVLNGPAGLQLGTDESSIPRQLGAVQFTLGVVAGTDTINPILSQYLPNPDDGKVSLESTKVDGMDDFIVFPHTHTFIMRSDDVIDQVLFFLQHGRFNHEAE